MTVKNTSGILTEQWELSTNANSLAASGTPWTLAASSVNPTAEQFTVQAVFGSSNTTIGNCTNASWNVAAIAEILPTTPTQYVNGGEFADSALNTGGGLFNPDNGNNMYAYNATSGVGQRALCWRVVLPLTTSESATQTIQVIVTAM